MSWLPLSIRSLSLLALAVLAVPLLFSLQQASTQLGRIAHESEVIVLGAGEVAEYSQTLLSALQDLERSSKQAVVLKEQASVDRYLQHLVEFQLLLAQQQGVLLLSIAEQLDILQAVMGEPSAKLEQLTPIFNQANRLAKAFRQSQWQSLQVSAAELRETSLLAQHQLSYSYLGLALAGLIAAAMVWVITRPLNQLHQGIQRWQGQHWQHPIKPSGISEVKDIGLALEQMRLRVLDLEAQKNQYLRHLSHELKTPLASICEGSALLAELGQGQLNPTQQEICKILQTSSQRLQQLIEGLLDFNLLLHQRSEMQAVELGPLCADLLKQHALALERRELQVRLPEVLPTVQADPRLLRVILDNLLSNSCKFAPRSSQIVLGCTQQQQVSLYLEDQGKGLDDEEQAQAFVPFFSRGAPQAKVKGSGLGLTIAKELAERMNLQLEYVAAASGCRFELRELNYA